MYVRAEMCQSPVWCAEKPGQGRHFSMTSNRTHKYCWFTDLFYRSGQKKVDITEDYVFWPFCLCFLGWLSSDGIDVSLEQCCGMWTRYETQFLNMRPDSERREYKLVAWELIYVFIYIYIKLVELHYLLIVSPEHKNTRNTAVITGKNGDYKTEKHNMSICIMLSSTHVNTLSDNKNNNTQTHWPYVKSVWALHDVSAWALDIVLKGCTRGSWFLF